MSTINPWLVLLLGILVGWLLEWLFDLFFFRDKHLESERRIAQLEADLQSAETALQQSEELLGAKEAELAALQASLQGEEPATTVGEFIEPDAAEDETESQTEIAELQPDPPELEESPEMTGEGIESESSEAGPGDDATGAEPQPESVAETEFAAERNEET